MIDFLTTFVLPLIMGGIGGLFAHFFSLRRAKKQMIWTFSQDFAARKLDVVIDMFKHFNVYMAKVSGLIALRDEGGYEIELFEEQRRKCLMARENYNSFYNENKFILGFELSRVFGAAVLKIDELAKLSIIQNQDKYLSIYQQLLEIQIQSEQFLPKMSFHKFSLDKKTLSIFNR